MRKLHGTIRKWFLFAAAMLLALTGCGRKIEKEPITLSVWHVYGQYTDSPLNTLIEEFNETVGWKEGIKIQVTAVSNTSNIHDDVLRAAQGEPGAATLPDLFISYPKTVMAMPDPEILVNYRDYFSDEELSDFVPEFLEEGYVEDRLVVFPIAKSTEIMFVDKTLFDRFAAAAGVRLEDLTTWQGLFDVSRDYYEWTDAQTPDVENDGKAFFVHDYWFNYFQVGVESLGENFFNGEDFVFGNAFEKAYDQLANAAITGGIWMKEGFATEPLRTGDAVVSVGSSASVLYYEDRVTYEDNRSEAIEMIAMPVPHFDGGEKMVMLRGAGFCTVKSTPEREKAAMIFLKWLTDAENNVRFVTETGYMPVTKKAFELLPDAMEKLENPKYRSLYKAYVETQEQYHFHTAPKLVTYLEKESSFETSIRALFKDAIKQRQEGEDPEKLKAEVYDNLKDKAMR